MDREQLMQLAAEKAIHEESWENIELLFQPMTMLELLLRLDFEGMRTKIQQWACDEGPDVCPTRFRAEPFQAMKRALQIEEFYRKLKQVRGNS
jgi:hypothetical protein